MSNQKLNQLFQAARKAEPPQVSATLAEDVMRALRQSPPDVASRLSLFEELNARFSELALVTVVILALGVAANLALGTQEMSDLGAGATQLSTQWFLLPEGL